MGKPVISQANNNTEKQYPVSWAFCNTVSHPPKLDAVNRWTNVALEWSVPHYFQKSLCFLKTSSWEADHL